MISIIIVNYNAGELLSECVQAALHSTVPVEVIVSDNASADQSLAMLRTAVQDERLHILENKANLGFAHGNNIALPMATGEYLLFLNPDCMIQSDTLKKLYDIMEQQPDVGMAGCLIQNPDGTEQAGCRRKIPTPWSGFVRAFGLGKIFKDFVLTPDPLPTQSVDVEAISGAFMFVRRSALNEVGTWDENYFLHCEDLDWCMRFQQAGKRILFIPTLSVMHVKGACSQVRPLFVQWHMHKGMTRFYRKFFKDKYPMLLMWLVLAGIWLRFGVIVIKNQLRRLI